MILIKAIATCDYSSCENKAEITLSVSVGAQHIPLIHVEEQPGDWIVALKEQWGGYACACPEHSK